MSKINMKDFDKFFELQEKIHNRIEQVHEIIHKTYSFDTIIGIGLDGTTVFVTFEGDRDGGNGLLNYPLKYFFMTDEEIINSEGELKEFEKRDKETRLANNPATSYFESRNLTESILKEHADKFDLAKMYGNHKSA